MVDKYLAWLNVQIMMLEAEYERLQDGRRKHDAKVRLGAIKDAKNSYCRSLDA